MASGFWLIGAMSGCDQLALHVEFLRGLGHLIQFLLCFGDGIDEPFLGLSRVAFLQVCQTF